MNKRNTEDDDDDNERTKERNIFDFPIAAIVDKQLSFQILRFHITFSFNIYPVACNDIILLTYLLANLLHLRSLFVFCFSLRFVCAIRFVHDYIECEIDTNRAFDRGSGIDEAAERTYERINGKKKVENDKRNI